TSVHATSAALIAMPAGQVTPSRRKPAATSAPEAATATARNGQMNWDEAGSQAEAAAGESVSRNVRPSGPSPPPSAIWRVTKPQNQVPERQPARQAARAASSHHATGR